MTATAIQTELWVANARAALAFYSAAFGATVLHLVGEGDDIAVQLGVGDAAFWIAPASSTLKRLDPRAIDGATSRTLLVVDDPDALVRRAVRTGATETSPVDDEHGWRLGRIVDPFGHEWEIGKPSDLARGEGHTTYTVGDPPFDGLFVPTGVMDYGRFENKLALPKGFSAPAELRYDDVVATAITRDHLPDDVAGINASLDLIRRTRGGSWPSEPTSDDSNFVWLVWHELEFQEAKSFTYALYTAARYLGRAYLYPLGRREPRSSPATRGRVRSTSAAAGRTKASSSTPRQPTACASPFPVIATRKPSRDDRGR